MESLYFEFIEIFNKFLIQKFSWTMASFNDELFLSSIQKFENDHPRQDPTETTLPDPTTISAEAILQAIPRTHKRSEGYYNDKF